MQTRYSIALRWLPGSCIQVFFIPRMYMHGSTLADMYEHTYCIRSHDLGAETGHEHKLFEIV